MNKNKSANKKSSIFSGLARFSEFIYSKMPGSLSARLLTEKNTHRSGLFSKLISKLSFRKRVSIPVKRYISKSFDNSFILGYLKALINKIPSIQLKCVGFFYFSFGLFCTIVHLVKTDVLMGGAANISLYLSVGACVVGGIFCGSQKSCYSAFSESRILSAIFFGFLNIKRNDSYLRKEPIGRPTYFMIAGVVTGVLGLLTSVQLILLLFPAILAIYALFAFPESGAVALFLAIPFLNYEHLAVFSALITLSWFIKLLRGKRILKFTSIDLTVLAFAVTLFFGGVISVSTKESNELSHTLLAMLGGYFAVSNLLRTTQWIKKCGVALITSFSVSLIAGAVGEAVRLLPGSRVDIFSDIFSDSVLLFMSINPVIIHMAVAVVPIMMLRALADKNAAKTAWSVCAVILSLASLFVCRSRSGTFAVVIGLVILLMLVSKKSLSYIIPAIIIIPLVIALMPSPITDAVDRLFSFDGAIASYRQNVNYTTNKIISDSLFGGIGLGESAFTKIVPLYTNDISLQITHASDLYSQITVSLGLTGLVIFLIFVVQLFRRYFSYIVKSQSDDQDIKISVISTFAGLSALLVMGLIDYIWLSPSVFLLFWLIAALFSASVKTAEADRYIPHSDEPTLEIDCKTLNHFSKRKG